MHIFIVSLFQSQLSGLSVFLWIVDIYVLCNILLSF